MQLRRIFFEFSLGMKSTKETYNDLRLQSNKELIKWTNFMKLNPS
jgi:hypothetical protein